MWWQAATWRGFRERKEAESRRGSILRAERKRRKAGTFLSHSEKQQTRVASRM